MKKAKSHPTTDFSKMSPAQTERWAKRAWRDGQRRVLGGNLMAQTLGLLEFLREYDWKGFLQASFAVGKVAERRYEIMAKQVEKEKLARRQKAKKRPRTMGR